MKERIAELCCEHEGHDWGSLPDDDVGRLCKPRFRRDAMCILDTIGKEIKKVDSHVRSTDLDVERYGMAYLSGFEAGLKAVQLLLGEEQ